MTILDSLGGQPAVVKAGEDPQLKLTPDAEALALFAGLFAMLQPQDEAAATDPSVDSTTIKPEFDADGQTLPQAVQSTSPDGQNAGLETLPAAARLMMDGAPAVGMPTEHEDMTETVSLARLLIAAKSLSEDVGTPRGPGAPATQKAETDTPTDMTTAKAILARAIEILDDIDSAPGQAPAARADTPLIDPESSGELAREPALPNLPGPIVRMMVQPAPAPEFVGPMPAVPVADHPAGMLAQPAPTPEFVGPMPAVPVADHPAGMLAQPAPSPEFVGPMPATGLTTTAGHTPAVPTPSLTAINLPPAAFQLVPQPAPSAEFVGPMPLHPVPLAGYGGAGASQFGQSQFVKDSVAASEGLPALKASPAPQLDAGTDLGQIRTRRLLPGSDDPRAVPGTTSGKADPALVPGVTPRDIRAYAEQAALAAGQSSSGQSSSGQSSSGQSSSGQSSSGQSSSGQSSTAQTVAAAGGQAGSQGGQNQSGQGGGQSSQQGFADATPSRDLADRTMLHRLNTANAGWSETMIKRLTSDLRSGVQTVRIILEPRHLGRLNVDLGLRNGKASIRIAAETAEAAKLLGSARGQLGQMLEQSGMRLGSFQTSAGGQDAAMDGNGGQNGQGQSGADGKNTGRDQGFSNKLTAADSDMRQPDDSPEDQDFAPRKGETAVLSVLA